MKGSAEALPNIQCPRKPLPSHSVCLCTGGTVWASCCHRVLSTRVCLHPGSSSKEQYWFLRTEELLLSQMFVLTNCIYLVARFSESSKNCKLWDMFFLYTDLPMAITIAGDTGTHLESKKKKKNGTTHLHKCQRRKIVKKSASLHLRSFCPQTH